MESAFVPSPRAAGRPLRVAVAAESQLARRRLAAALGGQGLEPVVQAADGDELALYATHADVLVLACDVSQAERMAMLRRVRRSSRGVPLVVVSPAPTGPGLRRALEAGADGLVAETDLEVALAASVVAVAAGLAAVPRRLKAAVEKPAFSAREKQVLALVAGGLTNLEIAERLFLSESTIKSHLSSSFAKLGVRSRKEAAALVLDPDEGLGLQLAAVADGAQVAS